jgi:hypothetical protein
MIELNNVLVETKCSVCKDKRAIGFIYGRWICGLCLVDLDNKLKERNKRMIDDLIFEGKKDD